MAISYEKLHETLKKRGLSIYRLRKAKIISESTSTRIRQNQHINTETIFKICACLECDPCDVFTFTPDEKGDSLPNWRDLTEKPAQKNVIDWSKL